MSPVQITKRMCGRYSLWCIDDLSGRYRVIDPSLGFRSHFNIAPGSTNPVIVKHGRAEALMMQWGLVPHRAKVLTSTHRPVNARAESLAEKPMFCALLETRRCLVPASGFFEWKQERGRRIPIYIHLKDEPVFAFAGMYDTWCSQAGTTLSTYAIITTAPNALVAPIHDRMPVILQLEDEERWLSSGLPDTGELRRILAPYPADRMEAWPVSERVNSPGADDRGVIEPLRGL